MLHIELPNVKFISRLTGNTLILSVCNADNLPVCPSVAVMVLEKT